MKVSRLLLAAVSAGLAVRLGACTTVSSSTRNSFSFDPPVQKPKNPSAVRPNSALELSGFTSLKGRLCSRHAGYRWQVNLLHRGNFTIYSKVANRRRVSSPGAGYPMTYWMEFKPAYGLHWGFVKPTPSTHGCVRMPSTPLARRSSLSVSEHRSTSRPASLGTRPSAKPSPSSTIANWRIRPELHAQFQGLRRRATRQTLELLTRELP